MLIRFTKMHSLGNDFIMLDFITQRVRLHSAHIKKVADRHLGIGCDQVIIIEPPINKNSDFYYRNFNADGFEVEQCGNGARCAAKFVLDSGLANKTKLYADCISGNVSFLIKNKGYVSVNMGAPKFIELNKTIVVDDADMTVHAISVGNPHIITFVENLNNYPVKKIGYILSKSKIFSHGANVSFIELIDQYNFRLRVFERGVGETLACGSAATAATVICSKLGLLKNKAQAHFQHGALEVTISNNDNIYLAGPVTSVFSGYFRI